MFARKSAELLLLLVLSTIPTLALARASSEPVNPTSAIAFGFAADPENHVHFDVGQTRRRAVF